MKKLNKTIALFIALIVLAMSAVSCADKPHKSGSGSGDSQIVSSELNDIGSSQIGEEPGESNEDGGSMESSKISDIVRPDGNTTDKNSSTDQSGTDAPSNTNSSKPSANTSSKDTSANTSSKNPSTNTDGDKTPSADTLLTYDPVDTKGMTDLQKAVVLTAESYYLRGARAQYDMSYIITTKPRNPERRLTAQKAPEDYTSQNIGYTDCSGFTYDVYWSSLDYSILDNGVVASTQIYANNATHLNNATHRVMRRWPLTDTQDFDTPEEIEAHKQEFLERLQPGDIIVYRYDGNTSGHAMLYVGNGMMIHSAGNNYKYTDKQEGYEVDGTYLYESVSKVLFDSANKRYLFNKHNYAILRPLNNFTGEIPEKTLSRMDKMRGIVAEKLASHTYGQTVNPGENITFTFALSNYSNTDKTLVISDTVPTNTTYVSGAQKVSGNKLTWSVKVPKGKKVEVSYTVKVSDSVKYGKTIQSNSTIEGIAVNCPKITVKKTLTKSEQTKIVSAAKALKTSSERDLELASEIYKKALGKSSLEGYSSADVLNGVYEYVSTNFNSWPKTWKKLKTTGTFINMLAPNMYGGKNVTEANVRGDVANARTRMVTADKLVVGDIIVCNDTGGGVYEPETYLYLGDKLLNLTEMKDTDLSFLDKLMGYRHFAVIRPSIAL